MSDERLDHNEVGHPCRIPACTWSHASPYTVPLMYPSAPESTRMPCIARCTQSGILN